MRHTREIFNITLPAIVSNITTPLLGLIDVAITGHLGSPAYIGAIALGGALFSTMYMLFGFLRMGTSGLTAQAYGAGDSHTQGACLRRAMLVAAGASVLLIAAGSIFARPVLELMGADNAESITLASKYFHIVIWGAPAVLATFALSGWFLGMQNSKAPMWVAIFTNVVNILVSLTLVYGLGWKIEGVAFGTLAAQWSGLGLALVFAARMAPEKIALKELLDPQALRRYFSLHADIFLRTCCLVAVTLWFTHAGATAGTDVLAANALLLQLFLLFSYFMDGFAYSGEALCGKYLGRGDFVSLRILIRELMIMGLGVAVAFCALYVLGGNAILALLSDDPGVRGMARTYLPWAVALPLCGFMGFLLDGVFIGMTMTRGLLIALAVATAVFFGVWFPAEHFTGLANHGLWLAFDCYLLTRGVALWLLLRHKISQSL